VNNVHMQVIGFYSHCDCVLYYQIHIAFDFRWKLMQSTMHLLLQRGASPNTSSVPMPVLFFAVRNGDVSTVQRLLSRGANPNAKLPDSVRFESRSCICCDSIT